MKFSRLNMLNTGHTFYDSFYLKIFYQCISECHMATNPWRLKGYNFVRVFIRSSKDAAMQELSNLWWWRRPFETGAGFIFWLWLIGNLFFLYLWFSGRRGKRERGQELIVTHFHVSKFRSWFLSWLVILEACMCI